MCKACFQITAKEKYGFSFMESFGDFVTCTPYDTKEFEINHRDWGILKKTGKFETPNGNTITIDKELTYVPSKDGSSQIVKFLNCTLTTYVVPGVD